jgi:hypothetical protein
VATEPRFRGSEFHLLFAFCHFGLVEGVVDVQRKLWRNVVGFEEVQLVLFVSAFGGRHLWEVGLVGTVLIFRGAMVRPMKVEAVKVFFALGASYFVAVEWYFGPGKAGANVLL